MELSEEGDGHLCSLPAVHFQIPQKNVEKLIVGYLK
jgi:hypothetical protein